MKPKILHIIDSFSKGGAEVLLAGVIPDLNNFDHHIIYLASTSNLVNVVLPPSISVECLNYRGLSNTLTAVKKLKSRITEINPDVIHTHLYFSAIFIRLVNPSAIPVIHTYHSQFHRINDTRLIPRFKKWCLKWIDQRTYNKKYTVIHVSKTQQLANDSDIGIKNSSVLYNYIEDDFFISRNNRLYDNKNTLKIISVGNLKTEKNHMLLLQALTLLKHIPIHLNICGQGIDYQKMQAFIDENNLPVTILGSRNDIASLLNAHDLFISCSTIEGFGISVAEAMAAEIPMIISDILTFKEITENKALFFESQNAKDLASKIEAFYFNPSLANTYTLNCKRVAEKYRKSTYVEKLNQLYHSKISVD